MDQTTKSNDDPPPVDKNSFMWKAFSALLNNEDFCASDEDLVSFCVRELNIKLGDLRPILIENLPAIVVAYMNMWQGWHSKELSKVKICLYFEKFKKFLVFKMRALNKSHSQQKFVINSLRRQDMRKPSLPFVLSIQCPPRVSSTLVFVDDGGMYDT